MRRSRLTTLCGLLLAAVAQAALAVGAPQAAPRAGAAGSPQLGPDTLSVGHRAALRGELAGLQAAIQQQESQWRAGETAILRLAPGERQRRLSERPWPEPPRASAPARGAGGALPVRLDWRTAGGDFVSGVRDQGACATGWIFAPTAALESAFLRAGRGGQLADFDLAEQQLLSCLDDYGLGQGCAGGWPEDVLWFAENEGLLAESALPYRASAGPACPGPGRERRFRFRDAGLVCAAADREAIKRALRDQGPLVTTMAVHSGFFAYTGGVYRALGELVGYHAVAIVGYDDAQGCYIAKNSWGESWGEGGFFRIAYEAGCRFGDWTRAVGLQTTAQGPYAAMAVSAERLRAGQPVQFKDCSLPLAAPIARWEWDFDGDGATDALGPGPHSFGFRRPGRYAPRLRVRDAAGREDSCALSGGIEVVFAGSLWTVDLAARGAGEEGDGSAARPFAEIQLALNAAADGDTILVRPGRYTGAMNSELFTGGKSLFLRAAGEPGSVILDGGGRRRLFRLSAPRGGERLSQLRLQGLSLWNGHDALRGGGIASEGVALVLEDCEVAGCAAADEQGAGGAIWTDAGLKLIRCLLRENRSGGDGGAIQATGASLELDGCAFVGNSASGVGGAISQSGGLFAALRSRFLGNRAGLRGGALALFGVSAGLDGLRFQENRVAESPAASRGGGAIAWEAPGADLLVTSCLFSENEAPIGGALRLDGGRFTGNQLTCWGNRAGERGGAFAAMAAGDTPELINSIFWGNLAPEAAEVLAIGELGLRHCLVAGGLFGQAVLAEDPRFVDARGGDFRLAEDSPCLGTGDPAGAPALDLAGLARPQPTGSAPDLGAFESALTTATGPGVPETELLFTGAYPNPFNPNTTFSFRLPRPGTVTLEVYQSSGRRVAIVLDEEARSAGEHRVSWVAIDEAGEPLPSGIYLARLSLQGADGREERGMQKIILMK